MMLQEHNRRLKLISTMALVLGGLVSFMGVLRHIIEGTHASPTIYLLHFSGLFFIASHFYVKKTKRIKLVSFLLVFVGFITVVIRVFNTGGLSGMPIAWYIGIPSIAAFVQGHKWVLPWAILCVLGASLPLFYPELVLGAHSPVVNYIVLSLLILTVSSMMWIFEKQRLQNESIIKNQTSKLIHSEKLLSIGALAGGMVYEINNPFAIIKGYSDSLRKIVPQSHLEGEAVTKIIRSCEKIDENVKRISNITKNLLIFTRVSEAQNYTVMPFANMFRNIIESNSTQLKNIHISLNDFSQNEKISCKPDLINQVISNLILNAAESIKDLQEKWIKIEIRKKENRIETLVTDSGPRLSEDISNRLFEPFFTTKSLGSEKGLGLSLCRSIVQMHGGDLKYIPESVNTQFLISFPIAQNLIENIP